jgi:hypothetical protein
VRCPCVVKFLFAPHEDDNDDEDDNVDDDIDDNVDNNDDVDNIGYDDDGSFFLGGGDLKFLRAQTR